MPPPAVRRFRGARMETPSHPGGVSTPARESLEEHRERQRQRERSGLYASTSGGGGGERERGHGRDRDSSGRGGGDERSRERGSGSSRSSHDHHGSGSSRRDERGGRDERDGRDRHDGRDSHRRDSRDERSRGGSERERDGRDGRGGSGSWRDEGGERRASERRGSERRDSERRDGGGGLTASSRQRSDWEAATPLRRPDADEWDMTPARPGGPIGGDRRAGAAPSPWESDTPRRHQRQGGGTGGSWGSSATPALPELARPGSASAAGGGASVAAAALSGGRVAFDVAPSPALTPSWKSSSWSKAAARRDVEEAGSPELRRGAGGQEGGEFDEALKRELELDERQAERDWCVVESG